MFRVLKYLFLLAGAAFLGACGSEGGSGGGATTYLTTSIQTGKSLVAFATYSSTTDYSSGLLNFEIKSNAYTGITPSAVQIETQTLTYTPIPFETYSTNKQRLSPTFTTIPVTMYVPLLVPGGGSGKIDNYPVFSTNEVAALKPLVDAAPAKFSKKYLKYRLDMTFYGKEVATNDNVSSNFTTEVWVLTP